LTNEDDDYDNYKRDPKVEPSIEKDPSDNQFISHDQDINDAKMSLEDPEDKISQPSFEDLSSDGNNEEEYDNDNNIPGKINFEEHMPRLGDDGKMIDAVKKPK
jgi:hypothetical protein